MLPGRGRNNVSQKWGSAIALSLNIETDIRTEFGVTSYRLAMPKGSVQVEVLANIVRQSGESNH
jgi:hypothetical protein